MNDLAIVIPAYKQTYFDSTLNSLAQQTNKNFTVYIGDDFSPHDLQAIADNYKGKLNIHYTRFPDNIGSKELVFQWKRCIALTGNEKWLCLFSDDDLMDVNCVENFYQTIKEKKDAFDVYRFNTNTIDRQGKVIDHGIVGPEIESSAQMAYHLLKGKRGNSMPDHVFSRKIYTDCGGFVFTEYAQGADWATSILFSKEKGICVIQNAKVYWRYSGINISSIAADNKKSMINGHLQFIIWSLNHFEYLKLNSEDITYDMILDSLRTNLKAVLIYHYKGFKLTQIPTLFNFHHQQLNLSYRNSIKQLVEIKKSRFPFVNKLKHLIVQLKNKLLFK